MSFTITFIRETMLLIQHLVYAHPDKDILFDDLSFTINRHDKVALIGNNGTGKSTLLKILAGELAPISGQIKRDAIPYYVPQLFGQYKELTIAGALKIGDKLEALQQVLRGEVTGQNLGTIGDDWDIEERCKDALAHWGMEGADLTRKVSTLSGGQKTKYFLRVLPSISRNWCCWTNQPITWMSAAAPCYMIT